MLKWTKRALVVAVVAGACGFVVFGTDLPSYVVSSVKTVKESIKDNVPVQFEIKRARDLLDELEPELRKNFQKVKREDIEVRELEAEIRAKENALALERGKLRNIREALREEHVSYTFLRRTYTRTEVLEELDRRTKAALRADSAIAGQRKILAKRRSAYEIAASKLRDARNQRAEFEAQIEALEGELRLQEAQAEGTKFQIDDSKLAQTKRLIGEIGKRLEVQKALLESEAEFFETIPSEITPLETEESVLERVDGFLEPRADEASF